MRVSEVKKIYSCGHKKIEILRIILSEGWYQATTASLYHSILQEFIHYIPILKIFDTWTVKNPIGERTLNYMLPELWSFSSSPAL